MLSGFVGSRARIVFDGKIFVLGNVEYVDFERSGEFAVFDGNCFRSEFAGIETFELKRRIVDDFFRAVAVYRLNDEIC